MSTNVSFVSCLAAVKQNPLKRKRDDEITDEKLILMMDMHKEDEHTEPSPPPSWEILCLLGPYMEPETLAVASCVSTTWSKCFSSEHLWKSLLTTRHSPFFKAVTKDETKPAWLSYKRLTSAAESASKRRRNNKPAEPTISLSDLVFIVHVSAGSMEAVVVKQGKDLVFGSNERFQIEADVSDSGFTADMKDVRMSWSVALRNYQRIFLISDTVVKSLDTKIGWFTDELPATTNRYSDGSKLVGDVKPSFKEEVLDKVVFAMADSCNWKSLFVDDVLRYLQCFLVN
ncbi:PREDICTED: probable F-box protein At5g04010 [Camelina sativa]|uniref:F-box protein n=1 Tax=Camelina sativa TaxID=90675 RepID=A0ABM0XTN8_CAMSA|nr:PREDICTED: probable F-box protein At5g04010 [Camelina sativa]